MRLKTRIKMICFSMAALIVVLSAIVIFISIRSSLRTNASTNVQAVGKQTILVLDNMVGVMDDISLSPILEPDIYRILLKDYQLEADRYQYYQDQKTVANKLYTDVYYRNDTIYGITYISTLSDMVCYTNKWGYSPNLSGLEQQEWYRYLRESGQDFAIFSLETDAMYPRGGALFCNIEVLVGISRSVSQICSINRDFSRVMKLLDRTFFLPETAVFWDDQRWDKRPFQKALAQLRGELRDMSDRKTAMDLTGAVERFMEVCRGDYVLPDKGAFLYLMQECCQSIAAGNGLDWTPLTGETTLRQLLDRVEELQKFCGSVEQPQNHLVAQTMSYINENYASELTLEEIADRIGISPSYLSRIFSQGRGQSVSSYITERRIEMAKHLICTTSLKHYEIAERCGLNSSAYFTSVFKKATGMTPNQYRNSVKK